jgi:hypothetical protein
VAALCQRPLKRHIKASNQTDTTLSTRRTTCMALLGQAAMLLSFDVAPEAIVEHDDWHTHEHLPERLSIPGFIRGSRWIAVRGRPRYFVIYEVAQLGTLTSEAYLQRLNNPTPWTSKVMAHYRGMSRGFCSVTGSCGLGVGHIGLLLRLRPEEMAAARLRTWLVREVLPALASRVGIGSAHLLEGTLTPQMTSEQRIRGADAGVDWAVLVTGYSEEAIARLSDTDLGLRPLTGHGAAAVQAATYRMDYSLSHAEIDAWLSLD